eukprot:GHVR01080148.1.p1 GENE.GHVR01080148.1~~GHVR01080148.1.p1  ORF type:complete len:110 (-),score=2.16 GHVR01080148.1:185-514(-)
MILIFIKDGGMHLLQRSSGLWNRPAYLWLKRHLYLPILSNGISKDRAGLMVFAVSGFIHEYVIAISTKKLTGWFLISMLCQVPLIRVSEAFKRKFPKLGNFFDNRNLTI